MTSDDNLSPVRAPDSAVLGPSRRPRDVAARSIRVAILDPTRPPATGDAANGVPIYVSPRKKTAWQAF